MLDGVEHDQNNHILVLDGVVALVQGHQEIGRCFVTLGEFLPRWNGDTLSGPPSSPVLILGYSGHRSEAVDSLT